MYKFLGLFAVFTVAFGCFPLGNGGDGDDGEIGDSVLSNGPTMDLSFFPPVEWTAPLSGEPEPGNGQMKNLKIASAVARKMIQSALLEAFVKQGILPPNNIDYGLETFDGQAINAFINQANAINGSGIIIDGIVANTCVKTETAEVPTTPSPAPATKDADSDPDEQTFREKREATPYCTSLSPNVIDRSFSIDKGPTLTGRQWKDIASKLEKAFITENVKLDKPIKVTA